MLVVLGRHRRGGRLSAARQIYFLGGDEGGRAGALPRPAVRPAAWASSSTREVVRRAPVQVDSLPSERPEDRHRPRAALGGRRPVADRLARIGRVEPHRARPAAEAARREPGGRRTRPAEARPGGRRDQAGGARRPGGGGTRAAATERQMSARNRELLALIPVAVLVDGGFTAVFIVESERDRRPQPDLRRLLPRAVPRGAHPAPDPAPARRPLPVPAGRARWPRSAWWSSTGSTTDLAVRQATLFLGGLVLFAATIIFLRDYHVLERYRYLIAIGSIVLLMSPLLPGIGGTATTAPTSGQPRPALLPALRVGEDRRRHLPRLAIWPRTGRCCRSRPGAFLGMTIPPLKHFGPLLVVWGAAMLMLVFIRDLGSSLMFFGAFLALLYVATSRLSYVARSAWRCSSPAPPSSRAASRTSRTASTSGSTRSARTHPRAPARSSSRCSPRPTAGCSAPASASRCCACRDPSSRTRARRGFRSAARSCPSRTQTSSTR